MGEHIELGPGELFVPRELAETAVDPEAHRALVAALDDVLEARIPELNPWAGAAVTALHSHTPEEECDGRCSVYTR